ncbi:TetR/AcrR family transcriptional regulator [Mesorhizobium sp. M7A.F.Ca.US.001.04.1.1]|uniref:TetR/AcrR family transcriptional regulator n=1 Tax=unclassified Mesorhizobium TaxID=325217 RepID=UPI000FC9E9C1|nr:MULTISPECIES: TetR/AcrR family transcriptional regulator [unclassified Mesorhizobium]RUY27363.1 TetR/AcrR family transcriptional regulator [Mesorhizobium sp. M7A.F.Ca.US.001.04.2.1]RUY38061.1 TetR/AcrR family transcriptional regulator [Mesorhizobium sp. M7A.F.Ca.US.001.04.1.1]
MTDFEKERLNARPGRPREFEIDQVLDDAIVLFSRQGYSASSVADLSEALKLTAGSIYKAFKDKRGLFHAALGRYVERSNARMLAALRDAPDGRARVRCMLSEYAKLSQGETGRTGCLVVASAIEFGASDPELADHIERLLHAREQQLRCFIDEGRTDGSIAKQVDSESVARALLCVAQGIRVLGKTGQNSIAGVVDQAMRLLD